MIVLWSVDMRLHLFYRRHASHFLIFCTKKDVDCIHRAVFY